MKIEGGYTLDGNIIEYFSVPKGSLIWAIRQLIEGKTETIINENRYIFMRIGHTQHWPGKHIILDPPIKFVPLVGWSVKPKKTFPPQQRFMPIWSEL